MNVDDTTLRALAASLKFRQMRQEVINSNIANAETPGYKSKTVEFEEALARAVDVDHNGVMTAEDKQHYKLHTGGFSSLEPDIVENANGVVSDDGNTVDMEDEMAKMAENKVMYDASVQLLNKKLALMKYAIINEK